MKHVETSAMKHIPGNGEKGIYIFDHYWGLLVDQGHSRLFGFDTVNYPLKSKQQTHIKSDGGCLVLVMKGRVQTIYKGKQVYFSEGEYFGTEMGATLTLDENTRVAVFQRVGWMGYEYSGISERTKEYSTGNDVFNRITEEHDANWNPLIAFNFKSIKPEGPTFVSEPVFYANIENTGVIEDDACALDIGLYDLIFIKKSANHLFYSSSLGDFSPLNLLFYYSNYSNVCATGHEHYTITFTNQEYQKLFDKICKENPQTSFDKQFIEHLEYILCRSEAVFENKMFSVGNIMIKLTKPFYNTNDVIGREISIQGPSYSENEPFSPKVDFDLGSPEGDQHVNHSFTFNPYYINFDDLSHAVFWKKHLPKKVKKAYMSGFNSNYDVQNYTRIETDKHGNRYSLTYSKQPGFIQVHKIDMTIAIGEYKHNVFKEVKDGIKKVKNECDQSIPPIEDSGCPSERIDDLQEEISFLEGKGEASERLISMVKDYENKNPKSSVEGIFDSVWTNIIDKVKKKRPDMSNIQIDALSLKEAFEIIDSDEVLHGCEQNKGVKRWFLCSADEVHCSTGEDGQVQVTEFESIEVIDSGSMFFVK